jgi:hypothetical protein
MPDVGNPNVSNTRPRALAIVVLAFLLLCALTYVARNYVLARMSGWHEWADFTVPPNAPALRANIKLQGQMVIVCNSGDTPWGHTLIQISDGYLADLKRLEAGKCKNFGLQDFKTNSWKKMPPPKDLYIGKVEILSDVTQRAYAQWRVSDSR